MVGNAQVSWLVRVVQAMYTNGTFWLEFMVKIAFNQGSVLDTKLFIMVLESLLTPQPLFLLRFSFLEIVVAGGL